MGALRTVGVYGSVCEGMCVRRAADVVCRTSCSADLAPSSVTRLWQPAITRQMFSGADFIGCSATYNHTMRELLLQVWVENLVCLYWHEADRLELVSGDSAGLVKEHVCGLRRGFTVWGGGRVHLAGHGHTEGLSAEHADAHQLHQRRVHGQRHLHG